MPIIKRQFAKYHEWIDTDNGNKLHSPDFWTPAYVHYDAKIKMWCRNGMQHREYDYPAFIVEGIRTDWCIRGYRYRLPANGHAVEWVNAGIDPTDPIFMPDEYWVWDRMTDENGDPTPYYVDIPPPEWVFWEGYLTDSELGLDKTLPDWFPPEPTEDPAAPPVEEIE